jgi:hypothetical protein
MWEFLIPLLVSALSGGVGSAISAGQAEAGNKRTAEGEMAQRRSLQSVVSELRNPNYQGVDAQFMLDLGRTLGQLRGQQAAAGTADSGRGQSAINDAVVKGLAQLGQFKAQDQTQREQQIANILSNPAFAGANPNEFNPTNAALGGFFGGALGGAGSAPISFLSTKGGTELLKNALGGSGAGGKLGMATNPAYFVGQPSEGAIAPKIDWGSYFDTPTFNYGFNG